MDGVVGGEDAGMLCLSELSALKFASHVVNINKFPSSRV